MTTTTNAPQAALKRIGCQGRRNQVDGPLPGRRLAVLIGHLQGVSRRPLIARSWRCEVLFIRINALWMKALAFHAVTYMPEGDDVVVADHIDRTPC